MERYKEAVLEEEKEQYRVPGRREKRTLAEEISKFSLCYALCEHRRAAEGTGRKRSHSGQDVAGIKAGILAEAVRAGDEVEGTALASPFTAIYRPRAYYPSYLLGEMRAAVRRGDTPPPTSPHYLPVSMLPPLPDASRILFLYQEDKTAFDRPDFPAHVRDVLTRDYMRLPMLLPPQQDVTEGRLRFRARLLRMDRDSAYRLAGVGENSYDSYSSRGLTYFLHPLELEPAGHGPGLRGAFFAELSLEEGPAWEGVEEILERVVCSVVEDIFPPCERGEREEPGCYLPHSGFHVTRFRRRLLALVYAPVIVVFRAPDLLGLFLPGELMKEVDVQARMFERFVLRLSAALRDGLGFSALPRVETAFDNRLPWARDGGALRGPSFDAVIAEHPFLRPTLQWLRGD